MSSETKTIIPFVFDSVVAPVEIPVPTNPHVDAYEKLHSLYRQTSISRTELVQNYYERTGWLIGNDGH